jgi:hypothetical protein
VGGSKERPSNRCRFLLAGLVALLLAFPFLEDIARPLILIMPLAAVFVAGVVVADGGRAHVRRALLIAAFQIAFAALSLLARGQAPFYVVAVALALLATSVLILFATYCVMRYVLRARLITRDQIYAGICMYVMLGFAFGAVFYLVNILDPNSFRANTQTSDTPDLMYFSFVTLATLGYGDITPSNNIARGLAVLEALVGMVYIAVFMARLVSMRAGGVADE